MTKFQFWKHQPSLRVWHVASLLHNVDPEELGDMVINEDGDGLDLSQMMKALIDGLATGELKALIASEQVTPSSQTSLTKSSVLDWLRAREYFELADLIDDSPPIPMKKEALEGKYRSQWPQIDVDLKHQATNGLAAARISHGVYDETEVVRWGREHGRLPPGVKPSASKSLQTVWPTGQS